MTTNYRLRITHPSRSEPVYVGPYTGEDAARVAAVIEDEMALPMPMAKGSVKVEIELMAKYQPHLLISALQDLADDKPGRNPAVP